MIEGNPRRDWFWLWVLGSLGAHAAILLAAPVGLPRVAPSQQLLQVSLAPPEMTRRDQEASPLRTAALKREERPSPARRASVSPAPRPERSPESTAQREKPTQPEQDTMPSDVTQEAQPTEAAEISQPPTDGLWDKVFASVPPAGGAVSTVDAMCGSGSDGDAADGADAAGERGAREVGAEAAGDGLGQVAAPVGQSLPRPAYPEEARLLRSIMPHAIFLVPGYGAQGGGAEDTKPCFIPDGTGAIVNSSRGVIFAYQKNEKYVEEGFADAARDAAILMKDDLNKLFV